MMRLPWRTGERTKQGWRPKRVLAVVFAAFAILMLVGARAEAWEGELRGEVDRRIESKQGGKVASIADDGEFLRRIWLDFTGMPPTSSEARAFLIDKTPSPAKREKMIDRLLDSPEFARRMATFFDVLWMERRGDKHVPSAEWREYLRESFDSRKPLDQLAREILKADGTDKDGKKRAAARFLLDRDADPNVVTRDIGRYFLGRDMQCCQCHDHPLIPEFRQSHYYGLLAYVNRSYVFQPSGQPATLAEKGEGDVTFSSVFKKKITHSTRPKILDGKMPDEPALAKGDEYWIKPADNVKALPKYSRRSRLGDELTSADSSSFRRNMANRLWAFMMGRGLVHPLDMDYADNSPSHPELLNFLADDLAKRRYDIHGFLRELALTRTYQRSSQTNPSLTEDDAAPETFAVFGILPLEPEQLGWSLMQAGGFVEATRNEVIASFDADSKLKAIFETDDARRRLRTRMTESRVHEKLDPNVASFINTFGAAAGQTQTTDAAPTVQQALFLANGEPTRSWIGALANRIKMQKDEESMVEELYLALFTRRPDPDEALEMKAFLVKRSKDRDAALKELCWALITSSEFRFKH